MRLYQEGKISSSITDINGVSIYNSGMRSHFSFSWDAVEITILNDRLDEISFGSFSNWENFSISEWVGEVEELTN